MNILAIVLVASSAVFASAVNYQFTNSNFHKEVSCDGFSKNVTVEYRQAMSKVVTSSYKSVSQLTDNNAVYAPFAIYLTLAALLDAGTDTQIAKLLYQYLNLPNDKCAREVYYKLASSRLFPSHDVQLISTRIFAFDDSVKVNPRWRSFVTKNSLFDVISLPIKKNPLLADEEIRRLTSTNLPELNLSGNSVLLNVLDFYGAWTTGFSEVERAPFYNLNGRQIGYVDLMRTRQIVKIGYAESIKSKVIVLPIGEGRRYVAMYALTVGTTVESAVSAVDGNIIFEILDVVRQTQIPFEVAIPQYSMTSDIDFRAVYEKTGMRNIWTDEAATKSISEPAALPSSFLQRVTYTVNATGIRPPQRYQPVRKGTPTGVDPRIGTDFIADRPFMMGIFDTELYTCVLASVYSVPTYPLWD